MQTTENIVIQGKPIFKADVLIACTSLLKKGGSETKGKPVGTFFILFLYVSICKRLIQLIE
ncbi:hypothetical protein AMD27_07700 [Acinetobacter sp. TGL-Y2]|uniref:hypothetical protein n=1 Tax=Acinetobacter sp. TGL-Y2 TaxID=1407071 RepID=UPI0007A67684|nr:hypothetical protein AMD27_07700 [Acinetobacter sp. TGL-Y2]